jgi:3-hydroxypropanoate dehydrogenase
MLDESARNLLFRDARSQNGFLDRPVEETVLGELYDLLKFGPTSANCSPLRIVFLCSEVAKERLMPALSPGNIDKTRSAPVVAVLGYDTRFFKYAQQLFPHRPAMFDGFAADPALARETAFRNSSLQAAVGLQPRQGHRIVLPQRRGRGQFFVQPGLRRYQQAVPALATPCL